jgi:hypothetical protein
VTASAYRRAIAECLREAVEKGVIERYYRVGSGARRVTQDARQLSVCCYLVDKLSDTPYWTHEPRLFLALSPLEPELGVCVAELRRMIRVEELLARSDEVLAELKVRVSGGLSTRVVDVQLTSETRDLL